MILLLQFASTDSERWRANLTKNIDQRSPACVVVESRRECVLVTVKNKRNRFTLMILRRFQSFVVSEFRISLMRTLSRGWTNISFCILLNTSDTFETIIILLRKIEERQLRGGRFCAYIIYTETNRRRFEIIIWGRVDIL